MAARGDTRISLASEIDFPCVMQERGQPQGAPSDSSLDANCIPRMPSSAFLFGHGTSRQCRQGARFSALGLHSAPAAALLCWRGEKLSYVTPIQSFELHLVFHFVVPFNVSLTSGLLSFL